MKMLHTFWTSIRILFAALGLGTDPEAPASAGSDLGHTIDPDG